MPDCRIRSKPGESVLPWERGENFKYLAKLNEKKVCKTIIPLAHPKFIMQYKRRSG
jgi:hypothetical protein